MAGENDLRGALNLPFKEQVEFFARKLNLPTERWDDIRQSAHDRAFVVAGATKADLLADLKKSIAAHVDGGLGLEGYRRDFHEIIQKYGWKGFTGDDRKDPDNPKDKGGAGMAWRTRVTYMTNLRTSYAAGRYQQLRESPNLRYWMWKHNPLVAEARPQHLAWDGLTLPADHPFWNLHYPPQIPPHWGCRCRVVGVEVPEDAIALGGDPDKALPEDWAAIDAAHKTQGTDWNYAPGANALMPLREMVEQKLFKLDAPIGAAMWEGLKDALALEQRLAWASMVDAAAATMRASNRAALAHVAAPATVADLAGRGVPMETADVWLRDAELIHAMRETKAGRGAALPMETWRDLPTLLEKATPYLDSADGGLLYVFDAPEGVGKVAVRVNYASKVNAGGKRDRLTSNFIRTGGLVDANNIGETRYVELKR